jgi:hypothetical protein
MFGVIRGQKFQMDYEDQRALMQHVCGLCLTTDVGWATPTATRDAWMVPVEPVVGEAHPTR